MSSANAQIDVEGTVVTVPAREVMFHGVEDADVTVNNYTAYSDFTTIAMTSGGDDATLFVRGDNATRADTLRRVAATLIAAADDVESGVALNAGVA